MEIRNSRVLILGGSGLVGLAIAREMLKRAPARLVITALTQREAQAGIAELEASGGVGATQLDADWGDVFVAEEFREEQRRALLASPERRRRLLDDLYGPLDADRLERFYLYRLIRREEPDIVVDCVNTATAIAYQDIFGSVEELRTAMGAGADVAELVERHMALIYLPQLIRHVQVLLEALRGHDVGFYLKVGTSGTGGMGLNVPFTHSEQRPSNVLLSKSGVAGAHSLFLYLMARTPGAPAVKEVKPTAAIAWKRIGAGPIERGGKPIPLYDMVEPVSLESAFASSAGEAGGWQRVEGVLESVYLDAGENGQFSRDEFETISSLGMMELVTPEEIATVVLREIRGQPTGLEIVAALDAASMGPTYRGGVLRELALRRMEELEGQTGQRSVAFEILGPPRLSKLLFEGHLLERVHGSLTAAAQLDPKDTAERTWELIRRDGDLRTRILSVGIPVLLPDGSRMLRGPEVKVKPDGGGGGVDDRLIGRGWVDLRPEAWSRWRERVRRFREELESAPPPDEGSIADLDFGSRSDRIRPGSLAAWVLRREDEGERTKR